MLCSSEKEKKKKRKTFFIPSCSYFQKSIIAQLSYQCCSKIRIWKHNLSEFQFKAGQSSSDFTRTALIKELAYGGMLTCGGPSCPNSALFQAVWYSSHPPATFPEKGNSPGDLVLTSVTLSLRSLPSVRQDWFASA